MPSLNRSFHEGSSPSLLEALSEGLHATAQPLTVLRATLEVASGNASCVSHYQKAIDTSLVEVSRVVDALGFVQELIRITRDLQEPVPVCVEAVVALVLEDLRCVVDDAGVSLNVRIPADIPTVMVVLSRLRQCLFHLVQQALSDAVTGDVIDLCSYADAREVQIVVGQERNLRSGRLTDQGARRFVSEARGMALAEVLAISQKADLLWQARPFVARLRLPASPCSRAEVENVADQS